MAVERADAEAAVDTLVRYIEGADGALREGLVDTPGRVISAYDEIFSGYGVNVQKTLDSTFNSEGYDGIVLLRDIEFHSTCEHHMLTFSGRAHVAYIPVERIVGISKLARLVPCSSAAEPGAHHPSGRRRSGRTPLTPRVRGDHRSRSRMHALPRRAEIPGGDDDERDARCLLRKTGSSLGTDAAHPLEAAGWMMRWMRHRNS